MTSPDPGRAAGIVLAGGRSTRMGVPKAGLPWRGSTLLATVVAALAPAIGTVVVVRAAGQVLPPLPAGVAVTDDAAAGRGPLEGLLAGLRAVPPATTRVVVFAVDLPFATPQLARALLVALDAGGADAAVPVAGGRDQPLAAAYRTTVTPVVARLLDAGERRLTALLDAVTVTRLDAQALHADAALQAADPHLDGLRDVDTPADLRAAQARGDTGTGSPAATPSPSSGSHASTPAPASDVTA